jgi:DNA-binding transcriptional regulator YhcF (GntR family)
MAPRKVPELIVRVTLTEHIEAWLNEYQCCQGCAYDLHGPGFQFGWFRFESHSQFPGGMAVSEQQFYDVDATRRIHRRDYIYSLERGKRYTVLLRRLFSWLDSEEVMVLGYLLSLANREHPSIHDMTTDLAMSSEVLKRALRSLKSKGVLFHDNLSVGDRQKPLWHISHPCRWSFSNVPFADSVDPFAHEPRTFSEHVPRLNEAREFILAQSDTIRVPNLLFRVQIGWRPRFVWAWLSQLPHDVNPTISGLSKNLQLNWRTIRQALDTLDEVGMIAIEEHQRRKFGRAVCLYFHLTDVHNWKFKVAQDLYPAPKRRPSHGITPYSVEAGKQERRDSFKPMLQSFPIEEPSDGVTPSNGSAFESRKLYFRSAESEADLHSNSVFSAGMTVLQPWLTVFQPCMTAKTPSDTPLKALIGNGSSSYNKAFIIKPIKESMEEEDARDLHSTELGNFDLEAKQLPMARIISIADSVSHVFVSSRNRKCDPRLWTDAVAGIFKTGGESAARQFTRYVADVYMARGNRPIAYNSLAIEDLSAAFLSGRSPSEIAAQETASQSESLTHALHSREKAPGGLDKVESAVDLGKASLTQTRANSERESPGCSEKENDRLRDLPSDPIKQRWLIHRIWPKLTKSQKSLLQDAWARFPVQGKAIRVFAAQDENCCLKVILASAEILQNELLGDAPPLPWGVVTLVSSSGPKLLSDASAEVARHSEIEQKSDFISEVPRSRLDAAIPILCRAFKPATRLSMKKGYARLNDGDLWHSLCGTFTEKRVRGVLSIIP